MNCFFRKYHEALFNSTKPYQYVGGEFLSHNKDFDKANVRFAFAFPDKYEIGISNLGVRVLYELINRHEGYMCDRVYAPEPDFKPELLYGLESKRNTKALIDRKKYEPWQGGRFGGNIEFELQGKKYKIESKIFTKKF